MNGVILRCRFHRDTISLSACSHTLPFSVSAWFYSTWSLASICTFLPIIVYIETSVAA